jgi:hypothetical protein
MHARVQRSSIVDSQLWGSADPLIQPGVSCRLGCHSEWPRSVRQNVDDSESTFCPPIEGPTKPITDMGTMAFARPAYYDTMLSTPTRAETATAAQEPGARRILCASRVCAVVIYRNMARRSAVYYGNLGETWPASCHTKPSISCCDAHVAVDCPFAHAPALTAAAVIEHRFHRPQRESLARVIDLCRFKVESNQSEHAWIRT